MVGMGHKSRTSTKGSHHHIRQGPCPFPVPAHFHPYTIPLVSAHDGWPWGLPRGDNPVPKPQETLLPELGVKVEAQAPRNLQKQLQ